MGARRSLSRSPRSLRFAAACGAGVLFVSMSLASAGASAAPATSRAPRVQPQTSGFGSNWTEYHENSLGAGVDTAGTTLQPLHQAWVSPQLDGQLYGEPLVEAGRVVVATENDTVYVLAAKTGAVLWSRHLATTVPANDLPCGDIGPSVGITGTPVIDPVRREIFVVADEFIGGNNVASHHLFGLNLYTGKVELNEVVDPIPANAAAQLQRTGLALDDGQVVFGMGGNAGDCSTYHGLVIAVPETGGPLKYYEVDSAPGQNQGAVWMGGAAPVVDQQGNVWAATGNGSVYNCSQPYDDSDSVLELSPSMKLEQFFAPSTWCTDNSSDLDLGTENPAVIGNLVFMVGKSDLGFLLHKSDLGGIGHEISATPVCSGDPDGGMAIDGSTVYIPCGNGLTAVRITQSPPTMTQLWTTSTGSPGPAIVAGGLVWTIDQGGNLWGLDPATGNGVIQITMSNGVANHFPTPAVGDGLLLAPATNEVNAYDGPFGTPPPPAGVDTAYWVANAAGGVYAFGGAKYLGGLGNEHLTKPIVAMAATPGGKGYWLVGSDGGVFSFGDARYHGSTGGMHINKPIVGIASTPDGRGYWLVASDGGVFAFGDARFHGSMGGSHLNEPIVGMAASPTGGYWLVASDGGIFTFGLARYLGSMGNRHLNAPIVAMAALPTGAGYWLAASDGGIFNFGSAQFEGSLGSSHVPTPVVGLASTHDGAGYWLIESGGVVAGEGTAFSAGDLPSSDAPLAAVADG
jgi:hypothetical protein